MLRGFPHLTMSNPRPSIPLICLISSMLEEAAGPPPTPEATTPRQPPAQPREVQEVSARDLQIVQAAIRTIRTIADGGGVRNSTIDIVAALHEALVFERRATERREVDETERQRLVGVATELVARAMVAEAAGLWSKISALSKGQYSPGTFPLAMYAKMAGASL